MMYTGMYHKESLNRGKIIIGYLNFAFPGRTTVRNDVDVDVASLEQVHHRVIDASLRFDAAQDHRFCGPALLLLQLGHELQQRGRRFQIHVAYMAFLNGDS